MAFKPTLYLGDHGPAVLAMQRALRRSMGAGAQNKANGVYGSLTALDIHRWKIRHGLKPADGHVFGERAWNTLWRNVGPSGGVALLNRAHAQAVAAAQKSAQERSEDGRRQIIVREAYFGLAHNGRLLYRQSRPFPVNMRAYLAAHGVLHTDCSGFYSECVHACGAPDPNRLHWSGYGFTGTLWAYGHRITRAQLKPGDAVLYGWERGYPGHVAVYVGGGMVISFGGEPGPKLVSVYYRTPVGYRSFPLF